MHCGRAPSPESTRRATDRRSRPAAHSAAAHRCARCAASPHPAASPCSAPSGRCGPGRSRCRRGRCSSGNGWTPTPPPGPRSSTGWPSTARCRVPSCPPPAPCPGAHPGGNHDRPRPAARPAGRAGARSRGRGARVAFRSGISPRGCMPRVLRFGCTTELGRGLDRVDAIHEDGHWSAARRRRVRAEVESLAAWMDLRTYRN